MAEHTNYRQWVIDQVRPLLPQTWKFSPTALTDVPHQTSVELMLQTIRRWPTAPIQRFEVEYTLNVIIPQGGTDDLIDQAVLDVIESIEAVPNLQWQQAERGTWGLEPGLPTNHSYTISLTFTFEKERTNG